jgi:pyruvate formate lyase activating enzyme
VRCGECLDTCLANAREILGRDITVADLVTEIEKDRIFFDESGGGVTFSGGEPLAQAEFLCQVLEACDEEELHTAVDTTCYAETDALERVAEHARLFLCDLKHLDTEKHEQFTGVRNELILSNIRQLSAWGKPLHLRIPLIPGFNDSAENIRHTADFIKSISTVQRIDVLPYNRSGVDKTGRLGAAGPVLKDFGPSDDAHVEDVVTQFRQAGVDVKVGG